MRPYVFIVGWLRSRTKFRRRIVNAHPQIATALTRHNRDWRTEMSSEDVERFEAAAGGLLNELSYSRAIPRSWLEALERASSIPRSWSKIHNGPILAGWHLCPWQTLGIILEERCDSKPLTETEVE